MARDTGLVYSTGSGRMCPACRRPLTQCACAKQPSTPSTRGPIRVRLETKGRRGKGVTVVTGVPLAAAELAEFGRQLRQMLGTGGTVKDGVIEIQGDHGAALVAELQRRGLKVK
jgi:translation initiation factor 1